MSVALITFSEAGAHICAELAEMLPDTRIYLHAGVSSEIDAERFDRVFDLTKEIFADYRGLVYVGPCGVVVRALAECVNSKYQDPAVVVVDAGGRYAISLLSGHEGGANILACDVAGIIGAEPIVTTTTEALKDIIVGVGCRRGTAAGAIVHAVRSTLDSAGISLERVRLLASADVKLDEPGLKQAAEELEVLLHFVSSREIRNSFREFAESEFVTEKVNLPAVAEPAALLAGRRTTLLIPKTIHNGVTVAAARESFLWSE